MGNVEFNKIISFDENSEFERINEAAAVEYFLTCKDDKQKKLFLDKFAAYVKEGLEERKYLNSTMQDLMFIIFNLYDDPYPLLVQFNELVEETDSCNVDLYDRIKFNNLDAKINQYRYIKTIRNIIANVEQSEYSCSDLKLSSEFKDQLIKYRNDIEFKRRKEAFLDKYGDLDEQELKKNFDYFISKEYSSDGIKRKKFGLLEGFDIYDKCNRYEIYRKAYTYSLKKYGDEKTKALFQLTGGKYAIAICNGIDLEDSLSIKRVMSESYLLFNMYDLSIIIFGSSEYQEILEKLLNKVYDSLGKDFEPVVSKYKQYDASYIIETVDFPAFLESNCRSVKDYCSSKNIDISLFKKGLSYLKDEALLRQVEDKKRKLVGDRFAVITSKVDKIVDYIMNGVPLDDNTTRDFDYLDYKLMTKLELDEFKKIVCKTANADTVRAVSRFIGKNKSTGKTNVCSILEAKNIVGYGTDKEHEITEEEKLATIGYLREHHLVSKTGIVDSKVYNLAIKRHLAGTLFEKDKGKINSKS